MGRKDTANGTRQFNGRSWFRDEARGRGTYEASYAMIVKPYFGLGGRDDAVLGLHMDLSTAEYGVSNNWSMSNPQDIREFLYRLHARNSCQLSGIVVKIYRSENAVVGLEVNPNLVLKPDEE